MLVGLAGSTELEDVKRDYQLVFIEKCRKALAPFTGQKDKLQSSFWAMLGAADALSHAAATGEITVDQAKDELYEIIVAFVGRNRR